jgi:hypothetical protein
MSTENPMSLSASSSLRALVQKWREPLGKPWDARYNVAWQQADRAARHQCADELSAALDAHQEEENANPESLRACQSVPVREPEATPDATAELLHALNELYPVPDDAVRVERCGRTAAVVQRWMSREMAEIEAMIPALIAQAKSGHDADCESELKSHGYTPCRCADRAEGR